MTRFAFVLLALLACETRPVLGPAQPIDCSKEVVEEKRLPIFVLLGPEPHQTERDAREDLLQRAGQEAHEACKPYNQGGFRLLFSNAAIYLGDGDCKQRREGWRCSAEGEAICTVAYNVVVPGFDCHPMETRP